MLEQATAAIEQAGLMYLFGGPTAGEIHSLHGELAGRETIQEWWDGTEAVWQCRGTLPTHGAAWYGRWLPRRGTFVATRLLPDAVGWERPSTS